MSKKKMFKESPSTTMNIEQYSDFIAETMLPLGFSNDVDGAFFQLKNAMFQLLFQQTESASASFDVEICFSSMIDDLVETYEKAPVAFEDSVAYSDYVASTLLPLGFSEMIDDTFFHIKGSLFEILLQENVSTGESFDVEICFNSMIDDLVDTYNEVGPTLLQKHRDHHVNQS